LGGWDQYVQLVDDSLVLADLVVQGGDHGLVVADVDFGVFLVLILIGAVLLVVG